jgi:uncharacterized GH25 family protein
MPRIKGQSVVQTTRHVLFSVATFVAFLITAPASAHEFIVKPGIFAAKAGETITATVYSTHSFIKGEEIEDAAVTRAFIVSDGRRTPIALQPDQARLVYSGALQVPTDKPFVLSGQRAPIMLATTAEGSKLGTRKDFPNARLVRAIEKFSKAFINTGDGDDWSKPVGDRLEIMIKKSPAAIKVGDEVPVQVLYDGRPIATKLYATYDGFSARNMTFAFYAEMEETETGYVKITHPGTWIIRAEHIDDTKTDEIDRYLARAVLVLDVK